MRLLFSSALVLMAVVVAACTEQISDEEDDAESTVDTTPAAETSEPANAPASDEVQNAVDSTAGFGFDMFDGLASIDPDENVITSPQSAAILLTMLLNGADGETREEIGDVLHLDDAFDAAINEHHRALAEYLESADPDVELSIANSLWANEGTPFEDEYLDTVQDLFDATIDEVDLGEQESADLIDDWVSDQTNERIDEMAEALGLPDQNAVLVLLNAVYFLGNWTEPFDPELTEDGVFTLPEGDEVTVPMMNRDDDHLFAERDGFKALRLPYGDEERYGLDVFLPDEGSDVNELRDHLDHETWAETTSSFSEQRVSVTMPSFELEYDTGSDLNDVLVELGMGIAFDGGSDFSPMTTDDVWLDSVVQKTFIRIDEEGTEAAAVTGGVVEDSMPPQFTVNRPFMFTISENETGTILFLGQVTDPSG